VRYLRRCGELDAFVEPDKVTLEELIVFEDNPDIDAL